MSLEDAAAALDRLIGRSLGGGDHSRLPSPHTTARNDLRSPSHKHAHYPQLHCPLAGPLQHLEHSPIYQPHFQNNELNLPKCSTPLENLAPPLHPFSPQWAYPLEHPQDIHQTVSIAAGSVLSPSQVSIPSSPLASSISPSRVSVFPVSDKLGSPLQHFQRSNQVSSSDVKERLKLPLDISDRVESDEFVPLDPEKYKTELCRSFQVHGSCKYSFRCYNRCNYAHGLGQLRSPSRHGKYKTRNCQSYHRTGFCRYGARCSFIHDPEEGVLRCSIANKEVLEALHFHPEDETRIANITWRLDDDSLMNQPASLHFIKSHTPLDENLDNSSVFLKTRESSSGNMLPLTWTQPIDNKTDLNCSTTESIEAFRKVYDNLNSKTENNPSYPFPGNLMSKEMQNDDFVLDSLRLLDELAAAHPILEGCQHSKTVKIEELADVPTLPKFLDTLEESHNLQCLEVVNDILKNAPNYSSSIWSVAADDLNFLGTEIQKKHVINVCDFNHNELAFYAQSKDECFNRTALGNELFEDLNYALACSTLLSEYDDEPIVKNASRKSSGDLNLADLIESLHVHEEHQLVRCPMSCHSEDSLDLSLDSQQSPDDTRLFDLTKYKTELCRSFQYNGFCKYGDACLYAHGGVDLRMYPKHPMYRTKKCFSFHNKGYCLYGSRCQFLHDVE